MLNRMINLAAEAIVGRLLKNRIRRGSIHAAKIYIKMVGYARLALLGLVGLAAATALMVTGLLLVITSVIELLPISSNAAAITTLIIGLILAGGIGAAFFIAFQQKRWLEASHAYDLMDTVLAPWEGKMPPNPVDAFRSREHHEGIEKFQSEVEKREEGFATVDRELPLASSLDPYESRVEQKTFRTTTDIGGSSPSHVNATPQMLH